MVFSRFGSGRQSRQLQASKASFLAGSESDLRQWHRGFGSAVGTQQLLFLRTWFVWRGHQPLGGLACATARIRMLCSNASVELLGFHLGVARRTCVRIASANTSCSHTKLTATVPPCVDLPCEDAALHTLLARRTCVRVDTCGSLAVLAGLGAVPFILCALHLYCKYPCRTSAACSRRQRMTGSFGSSLLDLFADFLQYGLVALALNPLPQRCQPLVRPTGNLTHQS